MAMGPDIRELTFQNVIDSILKPAGVKVGGYPDDIFIDMSEDIKEKWTCNICYLIVREARECDNKHLFCHTCCFAWSLTYGENSQKCPMCRSEQKEYKPVKDVDTEMGVYRVKCPDEDCDFRAPLNMYLQHSHGRARFLNDTTDLESLRPRRSEGARFLFFSGPMGSTPVDRARSLRDQLTQGRMMLHQMMILLQLEMQLRQQALVSMSQTNTPRRLDEVLALNEQLSEVGGILHALMSVPVGSRSPSETSRPPQRLNQLFALSSMLGDDDDTSTTSSDSSDSTVLSRPRGQYIIVGNRNRPDGPNALSQRNHTERSNAGASLERSNNDRPSHERSNIDRPSGFSNNSSNTEYRIRLPSTAAPSVSRPAPSRASMSLNAELPEYPTRRSDIRRQLYNNTGQQTLPVPSPVPARLNTDTPLPPAPVPSTPVPPVPSTSAPSATNTNSVLTSVPRILNRPTQNEQQSVRQANSISHTLALAEDTLTDNNSTSLPPINTPRQSAFTPVPPGSSTHQLTMRELAPSTATRHQALGTNANDVETPDHAERLQGARPRVPHSNYPPAPRQSEQGPSTSQSRVSRQEHPESIRTSGSYSPQKRFRRDSRRDSVNRSSQRILQRSVSRHLRTSRRDEDQTSSESNNNEDSSTHRPSRLTNNNTQGAANNARTTHPVSNNQLPVTPGSLMRARRRSEIQRELQNARQSQR